VRPDKLAASLALTLGLMLGCPGKGPGREALCLEASCEADAAPAECQSNEQCELGMLCQDGSCGFCSDASSCASTLCNPSGRCEPLPCATDDACPLQQICDGGQCVHAVIDDEQGERGVCGVAALYFAFDSAKLTPNNQERLMSATPCLLELLGSAGTLQLEAHADNLGGEQYSLLLAERRGSSVREFLVSMGVPVERMRVIGKGALEASGTDEPSRARDRSVRIVHVAP
jgi:peptidoglycan-associated lipoprotein